MTGRQHVLVVDDHPDNRDVIFQILGHAGFHVRTASNGAEALDRVRERRPDLILMDLSMPLMDGLRATQILKSDGYEAVPIIAVTARPTTRAELEPLGFSGLLRKPIGMTALLAAIRACLDGGGGRWITGSEHGGTGAEPPRPLA